MKPTVDCKPWGGDDIALHFNMSKDAIFMVSDLDKLTLYTDYTLRFVGKDDDREVEAWEFMLLTSSSIVTLKKELASKKPFQSLSVQSLARGNKAFVSFLSKKGDFDAIIESIVWACEQAGMSRETSSFASFKPPHTYRGFRVTDGIKTVFTRPPL
jgi:hypothetical protein